MTFMPYLVYLSVLYASKLTCDKEEEAEVSNSATSLKDVLDSSDLAEPEILLPKEETGVNETKRADIPEGPQGRKQERKPKPHVLLDLPSTFDFTCFVLVSVLAVAAIAVGSKKSLERMRRDASFAAKKVITVRDALISVAVTAAFVLALTLCAWAFKWKSLDFPILYLIEMNAIYQLLAPMCEQVRVLSRRGRAARPLRLQVSRTDVGRKVVDYSFSVSHVILVIALCLAMLFYLKTRHWVLQDLLNLAASVGHICSWYLHSVTNGLAFAYLFLAQDLFWSAVAPRALGTREVEDACRKTETVGNIVIPHFWSDVNEVADHENASFSVADIVVPGLFAALLLRYESQRGGPKMCYFVALICYVNAVAFTFLFKDVLGNKQALLPLVVPLTTLPPLALAALRGDFMELLQYDEFRAK